MVGDEGVGEVAEGGCFGIRVMFAGFSGALFFIFGEVADGVDLVIGKEFKYFFIVFIEMFEDMFLCGGGVVEVIFGE